MPLLWHVVRRGIFETEAIVILRFYASLADFFLYIHRRLRPHTIRRFYMPLARSLWLIQE